MKTITQDYLVKFWELIDEILNSVLFLFIGFELLMIKNLKDFDNKLKIEKDIAISLLFQNLGLDIKRIHPQYMKFLLGHY